MESKRKAQGILDNFLLSDPSQNLYCLHIPLSETRKHSFAYEKLSAMTLKIKFKLISFPVLIGLRQVKRFFEKLHTLTMLSMLSIS